MTGDEEDIIISLHDKIEELEQQITELKESQKQKQIIRLCERLDKAEQQNKELRDAFTTLYNGCHNLAIRQYCEAVLKQEESYE